MKTKQLLTIIVIAICLTLSSATIGEAAKMGTAFTYQGHLYEKNNVANGLYDFQFKLYDDPNVVIGNPIGNVVAKENITVSSGFFTVKLDFGSDPNLFRGDARWLAIGVRPGEFEDPNVYTILQPLQEITPAPYAIYSSSTPTQPLFSGAVYRWNVFDTFSDGSVPDWMMGDNSAMFGGINPSLWTGGGALASSMSSDKEVLRTLFTRKGYGGKNATVVSQVFFQYSSTSGKVAVVLFRIKNNTPGAITWTPDFYYTCYSGWDELASVALNGVNMWDSGTLDSGPNENTTVALSIPADRTSTVIFVSTSGDTSSSHADVYTRPLILAFHNNSLELPAGLEYVDDLDTATGGWEQ